MSEHSDLTAVFAANNQMALVVYQAARKLGLRIPQIVIVGSPK